MTYFKVLDGYEPTNGGRGRYPGINRWTKHLDPDTLAACRIGYHLADKTQLLDWLGPTIYEAEPCSDHPIVDGEGKWVTCRVRLTRKLNWDDRVARLFAADCAEAGLLGERASGREPDARSWSAVAMARQFAEGEATMAELATARVAAWGAAWNTPRARATARTAAAWDAARDAARAAARAGAGTAVWVAARAGAWAVARAAVSDAAWVGAGVAGVWDAAKDELSDRLLAYLYDQPIPEVTALYRE